MTPQESMLMYYMGKYTDPEGEFVVGRNDVANMLGVTVATARKRMEKLIKSKMITETRKPLARGLGYKYIYHITTRGMDWLNANFEKSSQLYSDFIIEKMATEMRKARLRSVNSGKKIKRSERQLEMFKDDN